MLSIEATTSPPRHDPPSAWPRQLVDDRFGFAWFIAPAVFVNQLVDPHATVTTVDALHDAIDHVIEVRRAELEAEGGITIIHDSLGSVA